jgi:Leucine-rich repeat (LRR) protein
MEEVEDYYANPLQQNDYYSQQAGANISSFTQQNYRRSKRTRLGFYLVSAGILLIIIGVITSVIGKISSQQSTASPSNQKQPYNPREPDLTATERPPNDPPVQTTPSPTAAPPTPVAEMELYEYLSMMVGEDALEDQQSVAYKAYEWMDQDTNVASYNSEQIRQRFAVACVYLATHNDQHPWKDSNGWMSSANECEWHGITCNDRKEILKFNLTDNGVTGDLPSEISLLAKTLLALDISGNPITNSFGNLAFLHELRALKMLNFQDTLIASEGIPTQISSLTKLEVLITANTSITGPLDGRVFEPLTRLRYLELSDNALNSTIPQQIADLPNLHALYAYRSGITGNVQDFLPRMKSIFEIWLDDNYELGGTLPTTVGLLTNLASFSISNGDLSGTIPSEIGLLSNMQQLWLYGNYLSGDIPSEIGSLSLLKIFAVEDNIIKDTSMPKQVCDLEMVALSADCGGETIFVQCDCCTCCEAPCPITNLPIYGNRDL